MGYCYGRVLPIKRGYRQLSRYQEQLSRGEKLAVAGVCVASEPRTTLSGI